MTKMELDVYNHLKKQGWSLYHVGWPDFLITNGKKTRFIEVKGNGCKCTKGQLEMHKVLQKCFGIKTEIVRFDDIYEPKSTKEFMRNVNGRLRQAINPLYSIEE